MAATEPEYSAYPCPECYVGTLRLGSAYYCTQSGGLFITAPNFPAWRCDVCGWREYDQAAVHDVQRLLSIQPKRRRSMDRVAKPATATPRNRGRS